MTMTKVIVIHVYTNPIITIHTITQNISSAEVRKTSTIGFIVIPNALCVFNSQLNAAFHAKQRVALGTCPGWNSFIYPVPTIIDCLIH